jgi:hypothetical protein
VVVTVAAAYVVVADQVGHFRTEAEAYFPVVASQVEESPLWL